MSGTICYTRRKQRYQRFLHKLDRDFNRFVYLKLIVLVMGLTASVYFLILRKFPMGFGLFLFGIVLLIYLEIGHSKVVSYQKKATILRDINEHSIWRLDGRWSAFLDTGNEFLDDNHPYSSDLDIFGQGSLFQWINVTRTYLGRQRLCHLLTDYPGPISEIRERQAAIGELADSLGWRQRFLACGIAVADKMRNPDFLLRWVKDRNPFFLQKSVVRSLRALPVLTTGSIIVYFSTKKIPFYLPLCMLLLQYGLLKIGAKKRTITLATAAGYQKNLELYANLLGQILKKNFQSEYLQRLKRKLFTRDRKSAGRQLARLARITESIDNRYNFFYSIVNLITLWDYQCLTALERWKKTAGDSLQDWLETIAEFEALSSLAVIGYDHPEWAVPELTPDTQSVIAEKLGHPLLDGAVRITNPLKVGDSNRVLLITGSNMSGKSTYLRTAGINLVLAFAGATVCATSFRCALLDIYTCMRIADNLEKNISSFYAEILRIKSIVEASAQSRPVFFLLDEIFKGTNSLDRHTGAKVLIKQLIQNKAIGLVSTHDLELGELAREQPGVGNFHFQEHFTNNQLNFDYKLRPGISTTRNAWYLMKAAGITPDEER
ncbi:MAG: DNA mismatch repair protein [Bacillota bacterium]